MSFFAAVLVITIICSIVFCILAHESVVKQKSKARERRIQEIEATIEAAPKRFSKKASKKTPVVTLKPKNNQNCPLCWEIIDSCVYYCDKCRSLYHVDCLEEMTQGICPTTGCGYRFLSSPTSQQLKRIRS